MAVNIHKANCNSDIMKKLLNIEKKFFDQNNNFYKCYVTQFLHYILDGYCEQMRKLDEDNEEYKYFNAYSGDCKHFYKYINDRFKLLEKSKNPDFKEMYKEFCNLVNIVHKGTRKRILTLKEFLACLSHLLWKKAVEKQNHGGLHKIESNPRLRWNDISTYIENNSNINQNIIDLDDQFVKDYIEYTISHQF